MSSGGQGPACCDCSEGRRRRRGVSVGPALGSRGSSVSEAARGAQVRWPLHPPFSPSWLAGGEAAVSKDHLVQHHTGSATVAVLFLCF